MGKRGEFSRVLFRSVSEREVKGRWGGRHCQGKAGGTGQSPCCSAGHGDGRGAGGRGRRGGEREGRGAGGRTRRRGEGGTSTRGQPGGSEGHGLRGAGDEGGSDGVGGGSPLADRMEPTSIE